jgi:hypothetical protein
MEKEYMTSYKEFLVEYKAGATTGEQAGEQITKQAQYFAQYNLQLAAATVAFSAKAAEIEKTIDDSGKQISSAKAGKLADATEEAATFIYARAHVQNISELINALKSLQKGILQEYSHLGSM